jgi:hypothetical protein
MIICKHYVNGRCNNKDCRFKHVDNICRNFFFGECNRNNCKYSHEYKFENNHQSQNNTKIKNTESFSPNFDEPDIRVIFNNQIKNSNEISINNNIFYDNNMYNNLLSEISEDVYKPWHGDTHLIADDLHDIDWKSKSPTFDKIIKQLCSYFCITPSATRLNFYSTSYWKPYHHDAAALKPNKAKTQNITVGVSYGETREISFESTHKNIKDRIRLNFPLENGVVYSFGNKVNVDFRHGIQPLRNIKNEHNSYDGRFSIIIWGYSSLLD